MWRLVCYIFALAASLVASGSASAQNEAIQPPVPFISEVRGGLMYHEDSRLRRVFFNQDKPREHGPVDVNFEVLFARPQWHFDNWLVNFLLTPRPRIGASINTGRGTSQASAGFAWDVYIWRNVFYEASLDIAIHNGWTDDPLPAGSIVPPDNLRALGCSPIFRQSLSLGVDITQNWRVMGTFEHLDNFGLCRDNQMLSNLGLRVGYRF
jgi:lipid A 3-O-deacylase